MTERPTLKLRFQTYPDLTEPKGFLPRDKRAQACWYYYTLAEKLRQQLKREESALRDGSGAHGLLEGELWKSPRYKQIAKSVALIYQLESPHEFLKFWDHIVQQANHMDYPIPHEDYRNPSGIILPS